MLSLLTRNEGGRQPRLNKEHGLPFGIARKEYHWEKDCSPFPPRVPLLIIVRHDCYCFRVDVDRPSPEGIVRKAEWRPPTARRTLWRTKDAPNYVISEQV